MLEILPQADHCQSLLSATGVVSNDFSDGAGAIFQMRYPLSSIYKKALVTGAGTGLGKGFAQLLLDEGVEVWGTSRKPDQMPSHVPLPICFQRKA